MLYACTTGTFLAGPALHADIGDRIRRATGIPGITTVTAALEALHTLGAKRVFMVTPYPARINDKEVEFLAYRGITVRVGTPSFTRTAGRTCAAARWRRPSSCATRAGSRVRTLSISAART